MKFGDYLKRVREDRGWTQPEAALKVRIEQSYLSKLETGKSSPSSEVFARLQSVYGLDPADIARQLDPAELAQLRDVAPVHAAANSILRRAVQMSRGWMIAGLACLFLGGGSIGLASLAEEVSYEEYLYRSIGVIAAGEHPDVYDVLTRPAQPEGEAMVTGGAGQTALRARQIEMLERVDEEFRTLREARGDGFYESVEGGRRYFEPVDYVRVVIESPLRWFAVPGLMFLLGSFGCFFISFRWK
ncbi:helix-turn-helix domain-containing protein [Maricaulis sp.]|uniref:helix-turn-helix domain-containing protein n=1 Tax=Maricaulis sp. TaxID=1486257 RepID=UPI003A8FD3B5